MIQVVFVFLIKDKFGNKILMLKGTELKNIKDFL